MSPPRSRRELAGDRSPRPFRYRHSGSLATIGKRSAVIDFGWIKIRGWIAWWLWGLAHIYFLIGVRNRLAVALSWLWIYVTGSRSACLITQGEQARGRRRSPMHRRIAVITGTTDGHWPRNRDKNSAEARHDRCHAVPECRGGSCRSGMKCLPPFRRRRFTLVRSRSRLPCIGARGRPPALKISCPLGLLINNARHGEHAAPHVRGRL